MAAALALLSSLLWGTADFFGGVYSRHMQAVVVVLVSQAIALTLIIPTVWLAGSFDDPSGYLWWGIGAGIVGPVALVAFYMALSIGTMGIVSPLAATGIVIPVVWGFGQGDRPSVLQMVGIVVGFCGVVLAGGPDIRQEERPNREGHARSIALALLAAVGFGFAFVCLDGGGEFSVGMTLLVQRSTSVLLMVVPVVLITRLRGVRRKDLVGLTGVGLGDAGANGAFAWSSSLGLLSVTAVLGSLYPVATLLLARTLLHERLTRLQGYGVSLALVGILLLAAG
ncbi:MAG TPA: EamA family transporter [Actinomycetes bacterium]|nr:EamA family transporter [Actinomycetes bacterium]